MKLKKILLMTIVLFSFINAEELVSETSVLDGYNISYNYTSGRSYNVKFEKEGISYRYLTGSKPEAWWGPFPYKAFEVEKNTFLASWFEKGYGDHVTLLINFNNNLLYGSALIAGKETHFHGAKIVEVIKP